MDWTEAQAKRDFSRGLLMAPRISRLPRPQGYTWTVELLTTHKHPGFDGAGWLTDARNHQPREFRTLDAAVTTLERIGFQIDTLRG